MQTSQAFDPLRPKTWQLDIKDTGVEGYLYHCLLCDEALVLSKDQISPKRLAIAFDSRCPGCGFELDRVLVCKSSILPPGRRLLTNLKCRDVESLVENNPQRNNPAQRASTLLAIQSTITTGIEAIDKTLVLTKGQMVFLQGEKSHALSIQYCVRTALPPPQGQDRDVVFIDAGNLFDTTAATHQANNPALDNAQVQKRIHLSRAFTHHQVYNLIIDKLPSDISSYHPSLAIVSDITALFCDPDVHNKKESLAMFRECAHFLATIAGKEQLLVLVTTIKTRNRKMENSLAQTAHVSALLTDNATHTQLRLTRHPFLREDQQEANLDHATLTGYFR